MAAAISAVAPCLVATVTSTRIMRSSSLHGRNGTSPCFPTILRTLGWRQRANGRGTAAVIQDGRWIAGDYEQDQFLDDGTFVLRWQLHWVAGWAPQRGEYRASMVDNYGNAEVYRGHIDGDRLVFESIADTG